MARRVFLEHAPLNDYLCDYNEARSLLDAISRKDKDVELISSTAVISELSKQFIQSPELRTLLTLKFNIFTPTVDDAVLSIRLRLESDILFGSETKDRPLNMDCLHAAVAIYANCEVLIPTDRRLIKLVNGLQEKEEYRSFSIPKAVDYEGAKTHYGVLGL